MSKTLVRWLVRATLCTSALAAQAQGASSPSGANSAPKARPDPLDAKVSVPALSYRSSFSRYLGLSDDRTLSWREANDAVARIGGWRVYAREAQRPESSPSVTDAATSPKPGGTGVDPAKPMPMPPGHSGHKSP